MADAAEPGAPVRRPRVLLADDYRGLVDAWRRLLELSCDVVGSVSNGREVVAAANTLCPDVVVLDIAMPEVNGIDACREIRRLQPQTRVVLVTATDDGSARAAGFRAGASAFVLKYAPPEELEQAIHQAFLSRPIRPTN